MAHRSSYGEKKSDNRHHVLWPRRSWTGRYQKRLRNHWYLVVELPTRLHDDLHASMSGIAVPNDRQARLVLEQIQYLERLGVLHKSDPVEMRINILVQLFDRLNKDTQKSLQRELELLT